MDLSEADLSFANLQFAFIDNANLRGVTTGSISGTPMLPKDYVLKQGYIIGPGTDLVDADLHGVDLSNLSLNGIKSGGIIGTPILPTGYKLIDGYIIGPNVDLNGADLSNANLIGVTSGGITGTPVLPKGYKLKDGNLIIKFLTVIDAGDNADTPIHGDAFFLHKSYSELQSSLAEVDVDLGRTPVAQVVNLETIEAAESDHIIDLASPTFVTSLDDLNIVYDVI